MRALFRPKKPTSFLTKRPDNCYFGNLRTHARYQVGCPIDCCAMVKVVAGWSFRLVQKLLHDWKETPPKGMSSSDFICIFATPVENSLDFYGNTKLNVSSNTAKSLSQPVLPLAKAKTVCCSGTYIVNNHSVAEWRMNYTIKDLTQGAKAMARSVFGKKAEYQLQFNHEEDGLWYIDYPNWAFEHHNLLTIVR